MTSDIDSTIVLCQLCKSTKPHKEPLVIYLVPDLPWLFLSAEILNWNGLRYLIPVDSYSGLLATHTLRDLSSKLLLRGSKLGMILLSMVFSVKCFLPVVHNLQVENFKVSLSPRIEDATSIPYRPQSNSLAENAVKQAKNLLWRCKKKGSDPFLGPLNLFNVRKDQTLGSPPYSCGKAASHS